MSQVPTLTLDGTLDGQTVLLDINNIIFALAAMNAGDTEPPAASVRANSWFADTNDTTFGGNGVIYLRNRDNSGWIPVFNIVGLGVDGLELISRNAPVLSAGVTNLFTAAQQIIPPASVGELLMGSLATGGGVKGRTAFQARDTAAADRLVASFEADVVNDSSTAMAVQMKLNTMVANTLAARFRIGSSLFAEGLVDQAAGGINATEIYRNNTALDAIIAAADIRGVDIQSLGAGATQALNAATFLHYLYTFTDARTLAFQNVAADKVGRFGILTLTASGGDRVVTLGNDFGVEIGGDFSSGATLTVDSGTTRKFIYVFRSQTQADVLELGGQVVPPQGFSDLIQFSLTSGQSSDPFQRTQDIADGETQLVTIQDIAQSGTADATLIVRVGTDSVIRTTGYRNRGDIGNSSSDTGCRIARIREINDRAFGQFLIRRTNGTLWTRAWTSTSEYESAGGDQEGVWSQAATYAGGQPFDRWHFDMTESPNDPATGSIYSVRRNYL